MSRLVVMDGAALLACAVQTPFSAAAVRTLEEALQDGGLALPRAALTEALQGALQLVRLGHLAAEDARRLPRVLSALPQVLAADAPLLDMAMALAAEHALPLPAAQALALARARKAVLATPDAGLAEAARALLGEERVRLLAA